MAQMRTDGVVERSPDQIKLMIELGVIDARADDEFCVHFMWYEVIKEFQALFGGPLKVPNGTSLPDTLSRMSPDERAAFRNRVLARPTARVLKSNRKP